MTRPRPAALHRQRRRPTLAGILGDRIRNDLTGPASTPGHLIRSMLAFLAVYAGPALLLPGSPAIRAAALVLAVVLALVDSSAVHDTT